MASQSSIFLPNVLLDESNYAVWNFRLESFLRGLSLFQYVDGSCLSPNERILDADSVTNIINPAFVEWKTMDQSVINMLSQTLSSRAMSCAVGSKSAYELWNNLKAKFADSNKQNIMQLKANLQRIKKGNDFIEKYLEKIKDARDALSTVGVQMADEDIVVSTLEGLPVEYIPIKTIIRTQASCSMQNLKTLLKAAEYDLDLVHHSSSSHPLTAMVANNAMNSASSPQINPNPNITSNIAYPISNPYPHLIYHNDSSQYSHMFHQANIPQISSFYSNSSNKPSNSSQFNKSTSPDHCQLCNMPGHIAKQCQNLAR
jgi:hypothetical protein